MCNTCITQNVESKNIKQDKDESQNACRQNHSIELHLKTNGLIVNYVEENKS